MSAADPPPKGTRDATRDAHEHGDCLGPPMCAECRAEDRRSPRRPEGVSEPVAGEESRTQVDGRTSRLSPGSLTPGARPSVREGLQARGAGVSAADHDGKLTREALQASFDSIARRGYEPRHNCRLDGHRFHFSLSGWHRCLHCGLYMPDGLDEP